MVCILRGYEKENVACCAAGEARRETTFPGKEADPMIGAIIGDIVGSVYEFDNIKTKDFPFFSPDCEPTDDSVMSLAVAKSILEAEDLEALAGITVANMIWLGNRYPHAGYGGRFYQWLKEGKYTPHPGPYNSFGNGSAMRASPCGFAAKTLEDALAMARITAEVTHNHPEGVKGAQATAAAIFLAKSKPISPRISIPLILPSTRFAPPTNST